MKALKDILEKNQATYLGILLAFALSGFALIAEQAGWVLPLTALVALCVIILALPRLGVRYQTSLPSSGPARLIVVGLYGAALMGILTLLALGYSAASSTVTVLAVFLLLAPMGHIVRTLDL